MKWPIIILNVLTACAFFLLGGMAAAAHRVHSYSTYKEFIFVGAVDEQKLKTLELQGTPPTRGYDMEARMRQIGNAEENFHFLAALAAGACIANAMAFFFLVRKREPNTQ